MTAYRILSFTIYAAAGLAIFATTVLPLILLGFGARY